MVLDDISRTGVLVGNVELVGTMLGLGVRVWLGVREGETGVGESSTLLNK